MKKGLFFFRSLFVVSVVTFSSIVSAETMLSLSPTKTVYSSKDSVISVQIAMRKSEEFRRVYFSTYRVKDPLDFLKAEGTRLNSPAVRQNDSHEPFPEKFEKVSILPDEQIVASSGKPEHDWDTTDTQFDLPILNAEKGVYLVEAYLPAKNEETSCGDKPCAGVLDKHVKKAEGEYIYTAVVISDVALDSRVSSDKMLIWGINRLQQAGASGLSVSLVDKKTGDVLDSKTTDENGFVEFNTPKLKYDDPLDNGVLVFAKNGKDVSFINLYSLPSSSTGTYRVYAYTDRPLYRPKDTVQFRAVVRQNNNGGYTNVAKKALTVVLYNADGEELSRTPLKTNEFGSVEGTFKLENVTPGNLRYTIEIPQDVEGQEGVQSFHNYVQVQAFEKASFEVNAKTSSESGTYLPGQNLSFTLGAQYYSGSAVREGTVTYNVYKSAYEVMPSETGEEEGAPVFARGARGRFSMNFREPLFEEERTASLTNGKANINVRQPSLTEEEKGKYIDYEVVFRVSDTNNDTVEGSAAAHVVPAEFQVSAEVEKSFYNQNETALVKIETKDYTGKNASRSVKLVVTSQGGNKNIYHVTTSGEKGSEGTLSLPLSLHEVGLTTVDLSGQDASGRETRAALNFYVLPEWQEQEVTYKKANEWESSVTVIPERRGANYKVGETARFLVLSAVKTPVALVTLDAETVLEKRIINLGRGWTVLEVELQGNHAPNFNVSVTVPGADSPENVSKSVKVEDDSMKALVSVEASSKNGKNNDEGVLVVPPGDSVEYRVSARNRDVSAEREEYEVSLAVVQEAIYALNPGYVQDVHDFFYGGRPVSVRRDTSYGYEEGVAGNFRLESTKRSATAEALVAPSGDSVDIRSDFRDTALWVARMQTQGGSARLVKALPDDLTTWRATAIAVSRETRVGSAETKFMSWKPLEVRLSIPKSLTEADELTATAVVQNNTKENKTTHVSLKSEGIEVLDETEKSVEIPAEGSATLSWRIRVSSASTASLTVVADGGSVTDGVKLSRTVLPRALQRAVVKSAWVSTKDGAVSVNLPENIIGDSVKAELLLTPSWAGAALANLDTLVVDEYHGNALQVATSLRQAVAVNQAYTTDLNLGSDEQTEKTLASIQKGVEKLKVLQKKDGGWGTGGKSTPSEAVDTAVALLALSDVEQSGLVKINSKLGATDEMKAAQKYLMSALELAAGANVDAQLTHRDSALVHLALTSSGSTEALDQLRKLIVAAENVKQDDGTYALLALALQNLQKLSSFDATGVGAWLPDQEASLLTKLKESAVRSESSTVLHWTAIEDRSTGVEETTALVIRALLGSSQAVEGVELTDAVMWLSLQRQSQRWTRARGEENLVSAFTLALAVEPRNTTSSLATDVSANGSRLGNASWNGDFRVHSFETSGGKPAFQLSKGTGDVFAALKVTYLERRDTLNEETHGLSVKREYFRVKKRGDQLVARPIRDGEVAQGDKIMVRLTVASKNDYANVLLTDYFPAGSRVIEDEPLYASTLGLRGVALDWGTYYQSTQHTTWDERVSFELSRLNQGETVLSYTLEIAKEADRSQALPAVVELKAYPALRGNTSAEQLTITSGE